MGATTFHALRGRTRGSICGSTPRSAHCSSPITPVSHNTKSIPTRLLFEPWWLAKDLDDRGDNRVDIRKCVIRALLDAQHLSRVYDLRRLTFDGQAKRAGEQREYVVREFRMVVHPARRTRLRIVARHAECRVVQQRPRG